MRNGVSASADDRGSRAVAAGRDGSGMENAKGYRWILVDLIKGFQMYQLPCANSKKQKVPYAHTSPSYFELT